MRRKVYNSIFPSAAVIAAAGLMFFAATTAGAQESAAQEPAAAETEQRAPVRLGADEAVEMAIKNNLSLESARVTSGTKKRASDLSWNQFIPSVTIGGSLVMDNEKSTVSGLKEVPLDSLFDALKQMLPAGTELPSGIYGVYPYSVNAPRWHVAGSIQASLDISIAMFEGMNLLRLDYQSGQISYEKAKIQLERDVRKAYNSMLLLQENIALLRENYEAAERRVQTARANFNAGLAPELTLLQAQVAVENMKPSMDQAENGLRLAMAQFAMQLGMDAIPEKTGEPLFELLPIENEIGFIPLDLKELISKAASGKPDIQELRHSILMLQSKRKTEVFKLLPALRISWGITPAFKGDPWKDNWFGDKGWTKTGSLTIGLGLKLDSLIPWSAGFQGIKNTDDQIQSSNIGLAQMVRGTEIEIYNTVLSLDRTRITAEAQQQTISLAERAYQLTEQAFRAGLQELLQVQNAELELKQARVSMLEQQFNYLNGLLDLEYSVGVPFGTLSSGGNQ